MRFYKYQATGNDFVMLDSIKEKNDLSEKQIKKFCDRKFGVGADGLILLCKSEEYDFKMVYYNANGKEGTMCGNGGRALVAFARDLGYIENKAVFTAIDGLHYAKIKKNRVSLTMKNVDKIDVLDEKNCFLDTGSPHHINLLDKNIEAYDVVKNGCEIRYGAPYFEKGTNVNFVQQVNPNKFKVRTYERGVENETLACGTGVTAVALAMYHLKKTTDKNIHIQACGGVLEISFSPCKNGFENIRLKGKATQVFKGVFTAF